MFNGGSYSLSNRSADQGYQILFAIEQCAWETRFNDEALTLGKTT